MNFEIMIEFEVTLGNIILFAFHNRILNAKVHTCSPSIAIFFSLSNNNS